MKCPFVPICTTKMIRGICEKSSTPPHHDTTHLPPKTQTLIPTSTQTAAATSPPHFACQIPTLRTSSARSLPCALRLLDPPPTSLRIESGGAGRATTTQRVRQHGGGGRRAWHGGGGHRAWRGGGGRRAWHRGGGRRAWHGGATSLGLARRSHICGVPLLWGGVLRAHHHHRRVGHLRGAHIGPHPRPHVPHPHRPRGPLQVRHPRPHAGL